MFLLKLQLEPAILGEGLLVAITGYTIVFSALVVLYLVFKWMSVFANYQMKQSLIKSGKEVDKKANVLISGEVSAAISMALFLHLNDEDDNHVVTIRKESKFYSPWSSKIHGLLRTPR